MKYQLKKKYHKTTNTAEHYIKRYYMLFAPLNM